MGSEDDRCRFVLTSGPENLQDICGAPAKWRARDGTPLCDKHKDALLDQQANFGVKPICD
jgi:hypothetical protein